MYSRTYASADPSTNFSSFASTNIGTNISSNFVTNNTCLSP